MIRKIPSSMGLCSYLLKRQEVEPDLNVSCHLVAFALTSPILCIVTFLTLHFIIKLEDQHQGLSLSIGELLLFTAGSYLYVAIMYVLTEAFRSSSVTSGCYKISTVVVVVIGMLIPLVARELIGVY